MDDDAPATNNGDADFTSEEQRLFNGIEHDLFPFFHLFDLEVSEQAENCMIPVLDFILDEHFINSNNIFYDNSGFDLQNKAEYPDTIVQVTCVPKRKKYIETLKKSEHHIRPEGIGDQSETKIPLHDGYHLIMVILLEDDPVINYCLPNQNNWRTVRGKQYEVDSNGCSTVTVYDLKSLMQAVKDRQRTQQSDTVALSQAAARLHSLAR